MTFSARTSAALLFDLAIREREREIPIIKLEDMKAWWFEGQFQLKQFKSRMYFDVNIYKV